MYLDYSVSDLPGRSREPGPRTPKPSMRTRHSEKPHSHERDFQVVPDLETARAPRAVASTSKPKGVDSVLGVRVVTRPFASTIAGQLSRHSNEASRQRQPESHRADQPLVVRSSTIPNVLTTVGGC